MILFFFVNNIELIEFGVRYMNRLKLFLGSNRRCVVKGKVKFKKFGMLGSFFKRNILVDYL